LTVAGRLQPYDFDGSSLLPPIERGEAKGREIYSEDLFEPRGEGALRKLIRIKQLN